MKSMNKQNDKQNAIFSALKELGMLVEDTNYASEQQISQRLRMFFVCQQTKMQFLKQLLELIQEQLLKDHDVYVKLKLLLLLHIIISSQIARTEFSKLLINSKLIVNTKCTSDGKDKKYNQLCQQYYYYLYKLASQTTLINEDLQKTQIDLMIYFTLQNQCYLGMNMQQFVEELQNDQSQIISNLIKFVYLDMQDIYRFIIKDVKYMVEENQNNVKDKKQLLELYKECQNLSIKMLNFYKFNRNFDHFNNIMPPYSIQIKQNIVTQLSEEADKLNNLKKTTKHKKASSEVPKSLTFKSPLTTKNENTQQIRFPLGKQLSPIGSSRIESNYFKKQSIQE